MLDISSHLFLMDSFYRAQPFLRQALPHALHVSFAGVQNKIVLLDEAPLIAEYFRSQLSKEIFNPKSGGGGWGMFAPGQR